MPRKQSDYMILHKQFHKFSERLDWLLRRVDLCGELCSCDEASILLFLSCNADTIQLTNELDDQLEDIKSTLDLYPYGECFSLDYVNYTSSIAAKVRALPNVKTCDSLSKLKANLYDLEKKLQEMQKEIVNPSTEKQLRIFENTLRYYFAYRWECENTTFTLTLGDILARDSRARLDLLRQERERQLQLLFDCEVIKLRLADYHSPQEAYDSLRNVSGPDGLDPVRMAAFIIAKRVQLKDYTTINLFLRLNHIIFILDQYIAEDEANNHHQEKIDFINSILDTTRPLHLKMNASTEARFTSALQGILNDSEVFNLMKTPELDKPYNLKLLFNIYGIMRERSLLPLAYNFINNSYNNKRREDYLKPQKFMNFNSSYSALTQPLYDRIIAIITSA